MSAPRYEPCGWLAPHEEHDHGIFHAFTCRGVPAGTEYALTVRNIKKFSQLRDEVAPAIRRTFPGVIVRTDECVIYSDIPDQEWRGGKMQILGLEYSTATSYERHLAMEFGLWDHNSYPELRPVTVQEMVEIVEHRKRIRK